MDSGQSWCNGQQKRDKRRKKQDLSVSNLLRHLHENILEHALGYFQIENYNPPSGLTVSSTTKSNKTEYIENVSEITGVAIPALFG